MMENEAVIRLDYELDNNTIGVLNTLVRSIKAVGVSRSYMFVSVSTSLSDACTKSKQLQDIIHSIETELAHNTLLVHRKIVEKGIGHAVSDIHVPVARNKLKYDLVTRQVRIPLSGVCYFNDTQLVVGSAYVIDNLTGYSFSASADSLHIILGYFDNNSEHKPWELWDRI